MSVRRHHGVLVPHLLALPGLRGTESPVVARVLTALVFLLVLAYVGLALWMGLTGAFNFDL